MKEKKNLNKGITLIALVITIIVLIILAGVSIATLTGDNGLLTKAQEAVLLTEKTSAEEEVQVEVLGSLDNRGNIDLELLNQKLINNVKGVKYKGEELSESNKIQSLPAIVENKGYEVLISGDASDSIDNIIEAGEVAEKTIKNNYTDGESFATIPEGFKVSEKEGEKTIKEGLVVINETDGNEFVWIPCTVKEYQEAKNAVMKNKSGKEWSHNTEYVTNGGGNGLAWSDDYSSDDIENINAVYNTEAINEITAKWEKEQTKVAENSISKYGGFYIARYEAGIPEGVDFYRDPKGSDLTYNRTNRGQTNEAGLNIIKNLKPVSKQGVQAWNYISQPNSKIVAENMYKASSEDTSVGSYLVDSQAWNHICENIYGANEKTTGKSITDSKTWGNYLNNESVYNKEITGLWANHGLKKSPWTPYPSTTYKKGTVDVKGDTTKADAEDQVNMIELPTGASTDFENYNIYDMAGNMWEWTTGHYAKSKNETMFVVPRGRQLQPLRFGLPSRTCER